MSTPALNVRIGGDIRELNKALKDAEKAVRTASSRIGEAARDLSTKLTLPLIGFGVVAIKAAGEIEALQKAMAATFQGAGRSLSEAATEVDNLRKAAEAPGLDFEQAIKASLRLQGVGLSAENARETIVQLANAIATSGGTAENLNGVTVQLAQIISKGKILNSDLMVMKENMPGLAKVMQDTFGTDQADRLREMGVSGKEFVERITAAMAKLPRVEGGISNSIVNAGTAIKMFLASVGESLNKTFNISTRLDGFAKWLGGLAEGFSNLDEGTKKLIAGVGVFAIALGPMLKVGQGVVVVVGAMIKAYGVLQVTLLKSLAGEAIPSAITAFKALNLATKLTILGAAIGIVLAAAAAFSLLADETTSVERAQQAVTDVMKTAEQSIQAEKAQVGGLISVLQNENTSRKNKLEAISQLNQISPKYFGDLKLEHGQVVGLTAAYDGYINNLLATARVKAGVDKVVALEEERKALIAAEDAAKKRDERLKGSSLGILRDAEIVYNKYTIKLKENELALMLVHDEIEKNTEAQLKSVTATGKNVGATGDLNEGKKKLTDTTKAAKDADEAETAALEAYQKKVESAEEAVIAYNQTLLDAIKSEDLARAASAGATDTSGGPSGGETPLSGGKEVQGKTAQQEKEEQQIERLKQMKEGLDALPTAAETAASAISSFGDILASSLEQGGASWKSFASAAVSAIAQVINQLIKMTVARAIASAIQKGSAINPLVGIALAGVAGTLAGALFKKLVGAAKFAKGTMNAPGGMALVGEEGPELINLPARSQVYTASQTKNLLGGGGGGGVHLSGEFVVRGTDLVYVVDSQKKKNSRIKGF